MKKSLLILGIIPYIAMSSDKTLYGTNNSNVKVQNIKRGKLKLSSITYTPLDFTLTSRNNFFKFNVKVSGQRDRINKSNTKSSFIPIKNKKLGEEENFSKKQGVLTDYFNPKKIYNVEYTTMFGQDFSVEESSGNISKIPLNNLYNFGNSLEYLIKRASGKKLVLPHAHSHAGHSHNHNHNHDHDHNHDEEHTGYRNEFDTFIPFNSREYKEDEDLGIKASIDYFNNKVGFKLTHYFRRMVENEISHPNDETIAELKTHLLLKDKVSLNFRPRLSLVKFNPTKFESDTDFRIKINENNFINSYMYNAIQLNSLDEKIKFKNIFSIDYDYNKEKLRSHKFYEIVDHEHEKEDRFRVKFSLTHDAKYDKPILKLKDYKYSRKEDLFSYNAELNLKKSNAFIDNLTLENNFTYNQNIRKVKAFDFDFYTEKKYLYNDKNSKAFINENIDHIENHIPKKLQERHLLVKKDENENQYIEIYELLKFENSCMPYTDKYCIKNEFPNEGNDELDSIGGTAPTDDDPFADIGGTVPTDDDPFADIGGTVPTDDDPFADIGGTVPTDDDPFADIDDNSSQTTNTQILYSPDERLERTDYVLIKYTYNFLGLSRKPLSYTNLNEINFNNESKISYKYKGYKFNFKNNVHVDIPSYENRENNFMIENNLSLGVEKKFKKRFNLKFDFNDQYIYHKYNTYYRNNLINTSYQINRSSYNLDTAYNLNEKKLNLIYGLNLKYTLEARKAPIELMEGNKEEALIFVEPTPELYEFYYSLGPFERNKLISPKSNGKENEALLNGYKEYLEFKNNKYIDIPAYRRQLKYEVDKWVLGNILDIKPYLEINYNFNKNIKFYSKLETNFNFNNSSTIGIDKDGYFRPVAKNMSLGDITTKFEFGIKQKF
ncbi:hypothetical protein [Oceanivirga miroungae]|uniref:Uncharacterized protein n=1 Tax=Oceanivirga miroungae TaxID=1130046 RepID=A0A6I8MEQ2_9FUSO|nr:hypothetical protein [Oceanivirga miroungae]VWL85709.1 hypothetical protein OMES3154_00997 [Oceanivirga miroungae]